MYPATPLADTRSPLHQESILHEFEQCAITTDFHQFQTALNRVAFAMPVPIHQDKPFIRLVGINQNTDPKFGHLLSDVVWQLPVIDVILLLPNFLTTALSWHRAGGHTLSGHLDIRQPGIRMRHGRRKNLRLLCNLRGGGRSRALPHALRIVFSQIGRAHV